MPTQIDREIYMSFINGEPLPNDNQLAKARDFFERKLKQADFNHEKLKKIITSYFSVVSIVLDSDDNPYLVFESLNAKGRPLTQADLIRNYFFMRIHTDQQIEIYNGYWQPLQLALKENLTEYIRHFLMRSGKTVRQDDVYYSLKENVSPANVIEYLHELKKYSVYYQRLIYPEFEPEQELQKYFYRLNRIEVTTAYPLLMSLYNDYAENRISKFDFITMLSIIENYLIRRFVCSVPTNQLNKIFPIIYPQLVKNYSENMVEGLKTILRDKGYPKDNEFLLRFTENKFYGAGDRPMMHPV
jgi:uncharacterized protein with ParB-like and HNH nuclease domain